MSAWENQEFPGKWPSGHACGELPSLKKYLFCYFYLHVSWPSQLKAWPNWVSGEWRNDRHPYREAGMGRLCALMEKSQQLPRNSAHVYRIRDHVGGLRRELSCPACHPGLFLLVGLGARVLPAQPLSAFLASPALALVCFPSIPPLSCQMWEWGPGSGSLEPDNGPLFWAMNPCSVSHPQKPSSRPGVVWVRGRSNWLAGQGNGLGCGEPTGVCYVNTTHNDRLSSYSPSSMSPKSLRATQGLCS